MIFFFKLTLDQKLDKLVQPIVLTLDLRPVSAADTDEACPVAKGHGGRAQQDVLKLAPSGILGIRHSWRTIIITDSVQLI